METTTRHPEFAEKLRSARLRSGKSQERIAAEVGTSRRHWIRWERGDHIPSPEFLSRIGEAVGKPEDFLPSDDDSEAEEPVGDDLTRDEYALYGRLTARIVRAKALARSERGFITPQFALGFTMAALVMGAVA